MILRELGMDILDETDKLKRKNFRTETRCVLSLFERFLPKIKTEEIWKILFYFSNLPQEMKTIGGVLRVTLPFDLDKYNKSSNSYKKEIIYKMLVKGLHLVNELDEFANIDFNAILNKMKEVNLECTWIWKRKKLNQSKTISAEIYCEHEIDFFRIYVIFTHKKNKTTNKQLLIELEPHEFVFSSYFGELTWVSESTISFVNRSATNSLEAICDL